MMHLKEGTRNIDVFIKEIGYYILYISQARSGKLTDIIDEHRKQCPAIKRCKYFSHDPPNLPIISNRILAIGALFNEKNESMKQFTNDEIYKLRELRKLLNILQTHGNVIVNGNISARRKMTEIVIYFQSQSLSMDDISEAIDNLDKMGYPAKTL